MIKKIHCVGPEGTVKQRILEKYQLSSVGLKQQLSHKLSAFFCFMAIFPTYVVRLIKDNSWSLLQFFRHEVGNFRIQKVMITVYNYIGMVNLKGRRRSVEKWLVGIIFFLNKTHLYVKEKNKGPVVARTNILKLSVYEGR